MENVLLGVGTFLLCNRTRAGSRLDVGCGRNNAFVMEFLGGRGVGIDVFKYEGLADENIVEDISGFPFPDCTFDTVTFIANLNHVPGRLRSIELAEAWRVLKPGGNIIVTMGRPFVEVIVHRLVTFYDRRFHTDFDMDNQRGMDDEEDYFIRLKEIRRLLKQVGFVRLKRRSFVSQWGMNGLFMGCKAE